MDNYGYRMNKPGPETCRVPRLPILVLVLVHPGTLGGSFLLLSHSSKVQVYYLANQKSDSRIMDTDYGSGHEQRPHSA